jgi:cytochrome c-type biogenesis protein
VDAALSSLLTAFLAGLLSVLSPCVLPLLPAYLSLVSGISVEELRVQGSEREVRRHVMQASGAFVLGFSAVFVVLGASATLLGRVLRSFRLDLFGLDFGIAQLAGLLIVLMGLHLTGVIRIPLLYREKRFAGPSRPTGPIGAALIGAAFAFGWTPCVGPILGGILTLAGARDTVAQGMGLLLVYSAGLAVPFLLTAWSVERFLAALRRLRRHFRTIEVASGVLLVAVGLLVLTNQLSRMNGYFGFLDDVVMRLEETLL